MANDVLFYTALARELNERLIGARIDKIYQPSQDEIVLKLRGKTSETLLISASPNAPRVYLTTKKRENPMDAPAFCMLLRKRIAGGFVAGVEVMNCDRLLRIRIRARTELRDDTELTLLAELMGRYSNILLLKEDLTIVDAIKRIPIDGTNRPVLPNLKYELQPHRKPRLDEPEQIAPLELADAADAVKKISGISKETAAEILLRGKDSTPADALSALFLDARNGAIDPTVSIDAAIAKGLYAFDYRSVDGEKKHFLSLSEASEYFFENKPDSAPEDARMRELLKLAKKLTLKYEKKSLELKEKIDNTEASEQWKHFGELLYNNIYRAKGGESILDCDDFENTCVVRVPLDPALSAAKNAEIYFKKYRKSRRAREVAVEQHKRFLEDSEYLVSIIESLSTVKTEKEISEAEEELRFLSGKRRQTKAVAKKKSYSAPLKLQIEGFTVYVGKNNRQNDDVTFQIADRADLWLHAKDFHGSHVVIKTAGKPVPQSVILRAAELAAYYSAAKNAPKAEVDYTEKRFVKRQGTALALVRYTDYQTVLVTPKNEEKL